MRSTSTLAGDEISPELRSKPTRNSEEDIDSRLFYTPFLRVSNPKVGGLLLRINHAPIEVQFDAQPNATGNHRRASADGS